MIEWVDSVQPKPTWEFLEDVRKPRAVHCVSVGWLVSDGKKTKSLAPNMGAISGSDDVQVSGLITIPACSVTRMRRLKEP